MINFAHRGASSDFPENTIKAFTEAIKIGATGIELDVHKSKDGKLVVIHDEDIERTFLGKGLVKDYNLSELKEFKNRKILFRDDKDCVMPTLEEVLELIKDTDIKLNIELKTDYIYYEGIESEVLELINRYKMKERIIISSFNIDSIKNMRELDSEIETGYLIDGSIDNLVEVAKEVEASAIHPNLRMLSKELIQEAHKNGLKVNVYTVDEPIYMRRLKEENIDGIFTNIPNLLKDIIEE